MMAGLLAVEELALRIERLEGDLGRAPNLATGAEGTGAFGVIAREVASRQRAEERTALYRGALVGVASGAAGSIALLSAALGVLHALGLVR